MFVLDPTLVNIMVFFGIGLEFLNIVSVGVWVLANLLGRCWMMMNFFGLYCVGNNYRDTGLNLVEM